MSDNIKDTGGKKIDIGVIFILGFILFIFLVYVMPRFLLGSKNKKNLKDSKEKSKKKDSKDNIVNPTHTQKEPSATTFINKDRVLEEQVIDNKKVLIELDNLPKNKNQKSLHGDYNEKSTNEKEDIYNSINVSTDEYYKNVTPCNGKFSQFYEISNYK